ncbi:MAG: DUF1501 domain-containing protein [Saprospiraceae bacterium]|nr:DUF1501 domain-containing protein [Saprospiraceae bacterium]
MFAKSSFWIYCKFYAIISPRKRDKVLGIVITEFARTIKENGSQGADHGTSNMMFTFGHQVNGGILGKILRFQIHSYLMIQKHLIWQIIRHHSLILDLSIIPSCDSGSA